MSHIDVIVVGASHRQILKRKNAFEKEYHKWQKQEFQHSQTDILFR